MEHSLFQELERRYLIARPAGFPEAPRGLVGEALDAAVSVRTLHHPSRAADGQVTTAISIQLVLSLASGRTPKPPPDGRLLASAGVEADLLEMAACLAADPVATVPGIIRELGPGNAVGDRAPLAPSIARALVHAPSEAVA
jgi:hypothetical protein